MYVADLHCDTISALYKKKNEELRSNHLQVDTNKMIKGNYILQNFAMFIDLSEEDNPYECCKKQIQLFLDEVHKNSDNLSLALNYQDIIRNRQEGKISAFLTIEEGETTVGDVEKLEEFYNLGARMMTFTWNYPNTLGFPASPLSYCGKVQRDLGLTKEGIEILHRMEELGMIVDVAHLSDKGFWDVVDYALKPFVCSHGNARSLCDNPRNLTDDMLHKIGEVGGVIGVNYYGRFLSQTPVGDLYESTVKRIADHILFIANKGGIDAVALGSDFDGMDGKLELKDCSKMELLVDELKSRGMRQSEIESIFYKNVLRLYQEILS